MKKRNFAHSFSFVIAAFLFCFISIQSISAQKFSFGIYETVKLKDVSKKNINELKKEGVLISEVVDEPVVGYAPKNFKSKVDDGTIKFVCTIYPMTEDEESCGLIALSKSPTMISKDIDKAEEKNNRVIIYFNWNGAKKWAELTRKNIGNYLAFVINNQVYSLPLINAEIKKGMAIIDGFNNKEIAEKVADALNTKVP